MYEYNAKVTHVVDGDTIDLSIDLGFDIWYNSRVRFLGIDTPESRTRDLEEKERGLAAKDRVKCLLEGCENIELKSHGVGKYGRCLGEIFITKNYIRSEKYHGKCINTMLVEEGHAVVYED